jgi:drug/metabolite transporter (DMT)-like permease
MTTSAAATKLAPPAPADSTPPATNARTIVALLLVYVIWSSTYLAIRIAVRHWPPFQMAGGRFVIAGAVLALWLRLRGDPLPTGKQWLASIPGGVLLFLAGNGIVSVASQTVSSAVVAVMSATTPLFAALFETMRGRRQRPGEWLGILCGIVGVGVLMFRSELRAQPATAALMLLAPIGWALGSTWARSLPMPAGLMGAAAQMFTGGIAMLLVAVGRGEPLMASFPLRETASVIYLIIFGSLIGFSAYTYLLRHTRPAVAMSYAYVNPVLAALIAAVFGDGQVTLATMVATLLIAASVATVITVNRPRAS